MARSINFLVVTIFIIFTVLTIAVKTSVAAPPAPPGPFDEWHTASPSTYQSTAQQLKPPLKVYFQGLGIVVNQLSIVRIIYSFWSNVGADNAQFRNWVQLVLNGQSLLCYVRSFIGIVGYMIVQEAECFPCPRPWFWW